jgi:hypothetical protein
LHEGREYRLDARMHTSAAMNTEHKPVVLIAPTWGDTSIFNVCGTELIEVLLAAKFHVIMRPHYQSNRLTPGVIMQTRKRFESRDGFEYIDRMGETASLFRSDILVTDWSAMALEYSMGLEKPVLFIDVPRRIRNPDWQELGIEPMESAIRSQVGAIVAPGELQQVPHEIHELLARRAELLDHMRKLRQQMVFRLGHSITDGANELARIADEQTGLRHQRDARLG